MANMSYCRFQNTAGDLADCLEALREGVYAEGDQEPLSDDELRAAKRLLQLCQDIQSEFEGVVPSNLLSEMQKATELYKEVGRDPFA
jgi:hypothetical protein